MISIVIPVYKAALYLNKCVDSILAQTITDWELILVDDGSPDNSGAICDDYANKDARVKVVHIPNGGPSNARNKGMEAATGDYVCFVDSDDWVEPTYLEHLIQYYKPEGIGVVVGGHISDAYNVHEERCPGAGFFERKNFNKVISEKKVIDWGYSVAKLYRLDVIREHDLKLPVEVKFCEDLIFFLQYLMYCDWIQFIDELDYHYIAPVGTASLAQAFHSFESEYTGYKMIRDCVEQMRDEFHCTKDEMEYTYRSTTSKLLRAITTMYRKSFNRLPKEERISKLRDEIIKRDLVFAVSYNHCSYVDRKALKYISNNDYSKADFILNTYYILRYNRIIQILIRKFILKQ